MAGKIIVSTLQSDTDNSISFVANTGATIFSANLSNGIAGSFIGDGSVTNAKLAGSITGNKIATGQITGNLIAAGQITGNLLTANCVSGNNIVASVTLTTPQLSGNLVSSTNSSIRFVSTNSYDGQQNSKIQWINENQNGVMAQISAIREQNAGAPGALGFYTNSNVDSGGYTPTEQMRITSGGNMLIGTTSSTGHKMTVQSSAGAGAIDCVGGSTNGYYALRVDMPSTNTYGVLFRNNSNNVGDIRVNSSTTAYNTSSDYRLKENIVPMTEALATVLALKPVTYTWKLTGEASQGFIAHELQAIVPDAVTGEKDAVDEEGNPVYQGVDTSFLVATLTAAIQELKTELDAAKLEIAALKNK